MKLQEALRQSISAEKHVDGPIAGRHIVSKANFSAGYYQDFKADDPERRSHVSTSQYVGAIGYDGAPVLETIASRVGDEGWIPWGQKPR